MCLSLSKFSWLTAVEGDPKVPLLIATTPRCKGGRYYFPWIAPLTYYWGFGMTRPRIETIMPMGRECFISEIEHAYRRYRVNDAWWQSVSCLGDHRTNHKSLCLHYPYIYIYILLSLSLSIYIYIYILLSLSLYIYIYIYILLSLSLYIYIYILLSLSLYIYIYIYIYIERERERDKEREEKKWVKVIFGLKSDGMRKKTTIVKKIRLTCFASWLASSELIYE